MTPYIGLLRAVNVGGSGKLPMSELKALCESVGCADVRTDSASGNVLFSSKLAGSAVRKQLEQPLHAYAGRPVGVLLRSAAEMAQVLVDNPFAEAPGNRVVAIFLDAVPAGNALDDVKQQKLERMACGKREIYVHYGDGMAD